MKNANPVSRFAAAAVLAAGAALFFGACAKPKAANMLTAAATGTIKGATEFFPVKVGDKVARLQLAVRSSEMQRGLMERRDLGRDDGMLFIYEKPQPQSFWMRNTPTALDIGFFDQNGVLAEVYPMHPFDDTPVASQGRDLQFALEMNQGWFRANGIKPGAKLDLKAVADALRERGFELQRFGLPDDKAPKR